MPDNVRVASNSTGVFGENPPDNSTLINQEIQPLPSCTGTRRPRTRNGNRGQLLHTKGVWTHPAASSRHTSVDGSTSGVDPVKVSSGLLYCFQCANALDGCPSRGKSTVNPHILSSLRGGCAEDFFFLLLLSSRLLSSSTRMIPGIIGGFTLTYSGLLDKPWSEVSSLPPPRYVHSFVMAHRVQHSHCSSIFIECC